jgi:hypothetical protein
LQVKCCHPRPNSHVTGEDFKNARGFRVAPKNLPAARESPILPSYISRTRRARLAAGRLVGEEATVKHPLLLLPG